MQAQNTEQMNTSLKSFALNLIFLCLLPVFFDVHAQSEKAFTKQTIMIPMDDGIRLATDIYLPKKAEAPYPCILIRTPYNKNGEGEGKKFTVLGYAVVKQDTRGKYESEGEFYPFVNERSDGLTTIKWIRSQSWSNGKIAGWGGSYVGYTQWAVADRLNAMVPVVTSANMYDLIYPSGIFSLATAFNWGLKVDSRTALSIDNKKIREAYSILPLSSADNFAGQQNDFTDDWIKHQFYDAFWGMQDHRMARICPIYSFAGWNDIFLETQIRDFTSPAIKHPPDSRLVIGPYAHGKIEIETDYGDNLDIDQHFNEDILAFLERNLKDGASTTPRRDPYVLFIMHRNEWYSCREWPPENTKVLSYFLGPDGGISTRSYSENKTFKYTYDPLNPYPSLGGTFLGKGVGPAYQNANINRKDQIVFEGPELENPLILLGPVRAVIFVRTDVPSTDFFVSLQEVRPDGKIINIQEGGRTVYNDVKSEPEIKKLDLSLWATGIQINPGHRLRVVITSALFPRYNRNINSGESIFEAKNPRTAHQTIYVGPIYPSRILLPVLNLSGKR